MNMKTIVTILLVIIAVIAAYVIFNRPPVVTSPSDNVTFSTFNKTPVSPDVFVEELSNANELYIIQDLRTTNDAQIRQNIQQCGIDFASSRGLIDKNLTILAFEGTSCISLNKTESVPTCLENMNKRTTIYIQAGKTYTFYDNLLVVGINGTYNYASCNIDFRQEENVTQIQDEIIQDILGNKTN